MELHSRENATATQRDWPPSLQKNQCFQLWNLEAKERQRHHSLQLRICKYRSLKQFIQSVNQLSVYGAVANWCNQWGLTEEGRVAIPVDNKFSTLVEPGEVELLV